MAKRSAEWVAKFRSPEYRAWTMMKNRCYNKRNPKYPDYGGRGIRVCSRWRRSFDAFLEDVGERPSDEHSLDRIDFNGHYEPGNVRWATKTTQARNRRSVNVIIVNGIAVTAQDWEDLTGVPAQTILDRIKRGWDPIDAIITPT